MAQHAAAKAIHAMRSGLVTPADVMHQAVAAATRTRALNALISLEPETAPSGLSDHALSGVPFALKDNFLVQGSHAASASRMLAGVPMPYDADVAARALRAGGASLVGTANMDEFGMGSGTAFSCHGPAYNPLDPALTPGGSSGGSAAAVAAGASALALGSDTGGSVRQPAAFCGIVGFKPSRGVLPRWGLTSYASSLDTPGVLARSVADAALCVDALAGPSARDATSGVAPVVDHAHLLQQVMQGVEATLNPSAAGPRETTGHATSAFQPALLHPQRAGLDLTGHRIGVIREAWVAELAPEAVAAWESALGTLQAAGATLQPVSLPSLPAALPAYYVIAPAEASSNLARYNGLRYGGARPWTEYSAAAESESDPSKRLHALAAELRSESFGKEVQRRIMVGSYVLSSDAREAFFASAVKVRAALLRQLTAAAVDSGVTAFVTPTAPGRPWVQGTKQDPVEAFLNDVYTVVPSLAGWPACSVPVHASGAQPMSVQVFGPHAQDRTVALLSAVVEAGEVPS